MPTEPRSVKVALDVEVPSTFTAYAPVGKSAGKIVVEMVGGAPHVAATELKPPMSPAELASVDWHGVAWNALRNWVIKNLGQGQVRTNDDLFRFLDEHSDQLTALDRVVDESRRYNRLNREQLDEVAELWLKGGSEAVRQHFHVSRRQADRYVKKAREAGAL